LSGSPWQVSVGAPVGARVVGIDDGADETGLAVGVGVGSAVGDAEGEVDSMQLSHVTGQLAMKLVLSRQLAIRASSSITLQKAGSATPLQNCVGDSDGDGVGDADGAHVPQST
jgi:hypothetical protein